MKKRLSWLFKRFVLMAMGIIVALGIAEIGLRLLGATSPVFNQPHPLLGSANIPNTAGWQKKEGRAYVQINSQGLRDCEHLIEKPDKCIRIAVLGDSYAEAMQVSLEESFPKILEQNLNEHSSSKNNRFEVINFGTSGFGTTQELIMLRAKGWKYSPDIVIVAMLTGNDIMDNSRDISPQPIPYYVLDKKEELVFDDSFLQSDWYKSRIKMKRLGVQTLINSSALLQLAINCRANILRKKRAKTYGTWDEPGLATEIYSPPKNKAWEGAWKVTEKVLLATKKEVEKRGAQLLVVTLSNGIQVYPDPAIREKFMKKIGVDDLFYPDRRIEKFCKREGIPILLLAPRLLEYAEKHNTPLHGFENTRLGTGHWNAHGQRMAGKYISEKVRELLPQLETAQVSDGKTAL